MKSAKLPEPQFRQIEAFAHQVHVTLENGAASRRAYSENETFRRMTEEQFGLLSSEERLVVEFLSIRGQMNITEAALVANKSWPTASKLMAALIEKGFVELSRKSAGKNDPTKRYQLRAELRPQPPDRSA